MLYTSQFLPLCQISLDDWQLVKISGIDSQTFLQGQLTADVTTLSDTRFLFSAHCDPKGKVLTNILLFKRGDDIYYIGRKSVIETQLKELKKYAVFSKVTIEIDSTLKMVAIAGQPTKDQDIDFTSFFNDSQNCITTHDLTYLKIDFPDLRYVVIGIQADIDTLNLPIDCLQQDSSQWVLLDMEAHYPIIDLPVSNQYLPQAFNLQNFDAISFNKGCYCGQEMVARAQYRGINKRSLYLLTGHSSTLPKIGDTLEQQMGESWRETGCVLATIVFDDNKIWIQAVLNNDIEARTLFRTKNAVHSQLLTISY